MIEENRRRFRPLSFYDTHQHLLPKKKMIEDEDDYVLSKPEIPEDKYFPSRRKSFTDTRTSGFKGVSRYDHQAYVSTRKVKAPERFFGPRQPSKK